MEHHAPTQRTAAAITAVRVSPTDHEAREDDRYFPEPLPVLCRSHYEGGRPYALIVPYGGNL